jgi:integrase
MKQAQGRGKHPEKALTAVRVKNLTTAGRYADGNGLYLIVDPSGAKRWVLRIVVHGRRRDIGLGSARLVPLTEAREEALMLRRIARQGGDPLIERRRSQTILPTFEEAAARTHAEHHAAWKNKKHAAQWISTLQSFAFPAIGKRRVDSIGTADILNVLAPIWLSKPETARRVKQRIRTVLDWASTNGFRTGENPVSGVSKGLPKQGSQKKHFTALPYEGVPTFIKELRSRSTGEITRLAFEFLILTAARTNEVLGARWAEFDIENSIWTIAGERMKAGVMHRIPLSFQAKIILDRSRILSAESPFVFPGRTIDQPMSNMALLMVLRRLGYQCTVHGFRSSFRDWASEQTNYPREVCEMALAHTIRNKAEAAYRRGDLLEKRRALMSDWASFVCNAASESRR